MCSGSFIRSVLNSSVSKEAVAGTRNMEGTRDPDNFKD